MPKAATVDSRDFDNEGGVRALLGRVFGRSPRDTIAIVVLVAASGAILANALYRQPGPHPAPIFSVKPRPVAVEKVEAVPARAAKAVAVPKAEPVQRVDVAPAKPEAVAAVPVPAARPAAKPDLIGDLISGAAPASSVQPAPTVQPSRVSAVQRALSSIGYGPVKATGTVGPETSAAIRNFERDRKLPPTGQVSPRLIKELATVTGKPID